MIRFARDQINRSVEDGRNAASVTDIFIEPTLDKKEKQFIIVQFYNGALIAEAIRKWGGRSRGYDQAVTDAVNRAMDRFDEGEGERRDKIDPLLKFKFKNEKEERDFEPPEITKINWWIQEHLEKKIQEAREEERAKAKKTISLEIDGFKKQIDHLFETKAGVHEDLRLCRKEHAELKANLKRILNEGNL